MAEKSERDLVELLLGRDVPLDSEDYSRHRRQLAERLREAARHERVARLCTIAVWCGMALFLAMAFAIHQFVPHAGQRAGLIGDVILPGCVLLAFVCGALALPMLIVYLIRYGQSLEQVRNSARDAVLVELQQSVEELKHRLP